MDAVGVITVIASVASFTLPLYFFLLRVYRDVIKINCYIEYVIGCKLDPTCSTERHK